MMAATTEKNSVSETIVCRFEPITKGFDFHWTIDHFPQRLLTPLRSPVFESLGYHWILQIQDSSSQLYVKLYLVDKEGNVIANNDCDKNDSFFSASQVRVRVTFSGEDGELAPPHVANLNAPLKSKLNDTLLTNFSIPQKLSGVIRGGEIKRIRMLFDLRVLVGERNCLLNKISSVTKGAVDMRKLLDGGVFSDFTIRTGTGKEIRAHRAILSVSSKYFEALFELGGEEAEKGEVEVPESEETMLDIVRFLYTGDLPEIDPKIDPMKPMVMYVAADKYQVEGLKEHYENAVDALISVDNVCAELVKAHTLGMECVKAKTAAFIRERQKEVVGTDGWVELCASHPTLVAYIFASSQ